LYLCIVRRIIFAWILLISGSLSMGLLPLTLHLCCEEARCHETVAETKANCCSGDAVEITPTADACIDKAECCDDVAFFNLAPFFSWGEGKMRLLPSGVQAVLSHASAHVPEINAQKQAAYASYNAYHPPAQSHLPVFLANRRLLI
jgi:hypothetical protein